MKKSIKILISVIILLFGFIFADCLFGFAIGGEFNLIAGVIALLTGILLDIVSLFIIFGKLDFKSGKIKEVFVIILIVFMLFCLFGYRPLNRISGTNDYVEKQETVVDIYGSGKGRILFLDPEHVVTVEDDEGVWYEVGDYNPQIDYDVGDTVIIKEYTGGFNLKYYSISSN